MNWIKVEDRLPEENQDVLIWNHNAINKAVCATFKYGKFHRYENHIDKDICSSYFYPDVTHWQPLAKAPKI